MLTTEEQILVEQRLNNHSKSTGTMFGLAIPFGLVGGHRFYIGKLKTAFVMIALLVLSIVLMFHTGISYHLGFISIDTFLERMRQETLGEVGTFSPSSIGSYIFLILLIWYLVDLFRIPRMVREYNNDVRQQIIEEINRTKEVSGSAQTPEDSTDLREEETSEEPVDHISQGQENGNDAEDSDQNAEQSPVDNEDRT